MYLGATSVDFERSRAALGGRRAPRRMLSGITPQQAMQCQQTLMQLLAALQQENYAWQLAQSYGESPPASDQHNAIVASLNAQIAAAQACLMQPIDYGAPAPAPAPAAGGGGTPLGPQPPTGPGGPTGTPTMTPGPIAPTPGAVPPDGGAGSLIETEVSTLGPGGAYLADGSSSSTTTGASSSGKGGLLLAILAAGAFVFGGAGCANSLDNRVYCSPDRAEASFTSWYFGLGVGAQINKRDAAALCGAVREAAAVR